MHTDIYSMSRLVDLSLKKDYETFAHEILGCLDNYYEIRRVLSVTKNIEPISVINGCVFIVKDLEKLILCVAIRSTKYGSAGMNKSYVYKYQPIIVITNSYNR